MRAIDHVSFDCKNTSWPIIDKRVLDFLAKKFDLFVRSNPNEFDPAQPSIPLLARSCKGLLLPLEQNYMKTSLIYSIFFSIQLLNAPIYATGISLSQKIKIRETTAQSILEQINFLDGQINEIKTELPIAEALFSIPIDLIVMIYHESLIIGPSGPPGSVLYYNFMPAIIKGLITRPAVALVTGFFSFKMTRIIQGKFAINEVVRVRELAEIELLKRQNELFQLKTDMIWDTYKKCLETHEPDQNCMRVYNDSSKLLSRNFDLRKINERLESLYSKTRFENESAEKISPINALGDSIGAQ